MRDIYLMCSAKILEKYACSEAERKCLPVWFCVPLIIKAQRKRT